MKFFNTLGRRVQEFEPIDSSNVRMYTCGPTVYNFAHIGNFRAYLFEDILKRTLEYHGSKVTQVMNLTDVDDKTIRGNSPRLTKPRFLRISTSSALNAPQSTRKPLRTSRK